MIVVPGVYDHSSKLKGDDSDPIVVPWIQEFMDWLPSDSRLMYYLYQSDRLFSSQWSKEAIRDCALHLLRSLSKLRSSVESQVRTYLS